MRPGHWAFFMECRTGLFESRSWNGDVSYSQFWLSTTEEASRTTSWEGDLPCSSTGFGRDGP